MRTLKLSERFVSILLSFPETGMGYQMVKVILKDGKELPDHRVLNSSILILESDDSFEERDISEIRLGKN